MVIDPTVEIKPLPDLTAEIVSEEGVKEGIRECELRRFGVRSSELGRIRRKGKPIRDLRIAN
jgi:hypothetical protein